MNLASLSGIARNLFGGDVSKPLEEASDQSSDEQKIVAYIKEKIDQVRQNSARTALEQTYLTNVAYCLGFDGVYFDTTNRQFKNIDNNRKISRSRFKINKILPTVQNRLARLTQSPPKYDVRPNSNSTEDKDASRLSLQILEDLFQKQRFEEKRLELLQSAMQGGISYLQVSWDPSLGQPMINPQTNELEGYEGDVRLDVLNCLEVFPDPLGKSVEECQHIIKAKVRKLDYFREAYPERGHLVREEDAWLQSSVYDLKSNALSSNGIAGTSASNQQKNSAIEIVYYEKRSKEHPNGRQITIANGVLLEDKELPCGEYNIVKFDDILVAGRYNAEAVITHLRPIQDQYNIIRNRCADWIRKLMAGKYLIPKGSNISQESFNDQSGEIIEATPVPNGWVPQPVAVPMIPQYVYNDLDKLDMEFDFVSGINEISRGILPAASMPASGMALLQEQDQTRIGVQTLRNEMGYSKVGQLNLKYVSKYYKIPRVAKMAGDGLEYAIKDFVGADLQENYDCIVIPGSTVPSSKVMKRQDITNAYMQGLLGNPQDPKVQSKVLKLMEFGDVAEMWKEQALDEAQVKRIIDAIEKGDNRMVEAMLNTFDNQAFHLQEMNSYRKTDKFMALEPQKQKLFMFVMDWRLQALTNLQNPQMAQDVNQAQLMVDNMHKEEQAGNNVVDMQGNPVNQAPPMEGAM